MGQRRSQPQPCPVPRQLPLRLGSQQEPSAAPWACCRRCPHQQHRRHRLRSLAHNSQVQRPRRTVRPHRSSLKEPGGARHVQKRSQRAATAKGESAQRLPHHSQAATQQPRRHQQFAPSLACPAVARRIVELLLLRVQMSVQAQHDLSALGSEGPCCGCRRRHQRRHQRCLLRKRPAHVPRHPRQQRRQRQQQLRRHLRGAQTQHQQTTQSRQLQLRLTLSALPAPWLAWPAAPPWRAAVPLAAWTCSPCPPLQSQTTTRTMLMRMTLEKLQRLRLRTQRP